MHQHEKFRHGATYATRLLRWLFVGAFGFASSVGTVTASEIYKSVDANGHVVYSDHVDPTTSGTTTIQLDDANSRPRELHFCWTNCFTLVLDNGVYHRADGTDETWTVETFSTQAIVLHRHDAPADWNGQSQDVVYAGQVANDRLIGVTVNGKPTSGIDASWGSALNTLPGSNAERDAPNIESPNSPSGGIVKSDTTPPPLQEEDQPPLVQDGYLWTPGYWYWRDLRYVWMPGAWARPPQIGFLWTPAYWGRAGAVFVFHPGHWGSTVGFYGGVNYGFGYFGNGYSGGHWIGNSFAYNSAVNHVGPTVAHHTYSESVPNQAIRGASSYAGTTRSDGGTPAISQHPAVTRPLVKPAPSIVAQRSSESAPAPAEVNKSAATLKASNPNSSAKISHTTTNRSVPVKQ